MYRVIKKGLWISDLGDGRVRFLGVGTILGADRIEDRVCTDIGDCPDGCCIDCLKSKRFIEEVQYVQGS